MAQRRNDLFSSLLMSENPLKGKEAQVCRINRSEMSPPQLDQLTAARETLEEWSTAARDWRDWREIEAELNALEEREFELERGLISYPYQLQDSVTSKLNKYHKIRFTGNDIHDYFQSEFSSRNDVWQEMDAERETLITQSRDRQNQLAQLNKIITTELLDAMERGEADQLMRDITAKFLYLKIQLGVGEMKARDLRERKKVRENEEMVAFVGLLNHCSNRPLPTFGVAQIIKT